jgi:hypothetical protein
MPKVEIEEDELARLNRVQNTLRTIVGNPKAKVLLEQAHKLVDPQAVTPELDRINEIKEPVSVVEKKVDDFIAAQTKRDEEREKKEKLDALSAKYDRQKQQLISGTMTGEKWTDEGVKKLETFMQDRGIIDFDIAVPAFERLHPPPPPATPSSSRWDFTEIGTGDADKDLKAMLDSRGNNEVLTDKMAHDALREYREAMGLQSRR